MAESIAQIQYAVRGKSERKESPVPYITVHDRLYKRSTY
jgi:hypothetical protein